MGPLTGANRSAERNRGAYRLHVEAKKEVRGAFHFGPLLDEASMRNNFSSILARAKLSLTRVTSFMGKTAPPIDTSQYSHELSSPLSTEIIVHQARARVAHLSLVSIDLDERRTRPHPEGVEVRAWYLVPAKDLANEQLSDPTWLSVLSTLDPLARMALVLSQTEGCDSNQIARALGMPPRNARRHLRRAIAAIAAIRHRQS
jgi:hypothetical protein